MNTPTPASCEIRLTVPFHDLDPIQVVWHGNYLKYFDRARFALFKSVGIDLYRLHEQSRYLFPVTRTTTKYVLPLKYGDEFICKASVKEAEIKIVLDFEIRRVSDHSLCATGRGEQVAVKTPEMELQFEIPHEIRVALGTSGG
jgi:acyl-CoA thioester hydrolase